MEGFKKNIYLLTEEETKRALTLSEIAQLRKGQRFQSGVTFSQDMTDYDVRNLLESLFPDILPNKRFSCATRDGQSSSQFNFHGEHRVWDGRTIKRKVKGQSAMYLVLKDVVEDKLVFNPVLPARGTPSSLQGHSLSTSFCHNSKNSQTVSLTQTPQSATTVTSMNTTNSTENAAERWTELEQNMLTNNPDVLDDILSSLNVSDIGFENLLSPIGFGAVETISEASSLTNGSQEHNQPQNQIPSISTDTFQSDDSAFSSSEETVSQNGIFSVHGTTQRGRVTKPIRAMGKDCLPSDKRDSSGQSDSGISSEANGQAPNPPISLRIQKAAMEPTEGPLQGGGLFQAEIEEELPPSVKTGWAIFGKKSVKVRVSRDGLALSGKGIPRGDAPGPVTVTFTTLNGECVAKGTYTYRETENPTTRQSIRTKRAFDEFDESVKRLKREFGLCDESDECTAEGNHETGGDAPGPVTVTFTTLNGECVAKETHTHRESENLTIWQSSRTKRAFDDFDESVKRLKREFGLCDESDECAAEGNHETGGDALGPVTVTFTTLNGECVAKETHTYRENENPTNWQSTRTKRAFDEFEESVKRFETDFGSCDGSDQFAAEKYHETGVTQVVKAQLAEEGYLGDTETSDTEDKDSDLVDNNENEIEEGLLNGRRKIAIETSGTIKLNGNREGDELKKSQAFPSQRQTEIPSQVEVIYDVWGSMRAATNIWTEAAGSLYGAGDHLHLLFRRQRQRQRVEQHREVDQMRRQKAKTTETQSSLMELRWHYYEAEKQRWREMQQILAQIAESFHDWIISRNEVQVTDKRLGSGDWATVYEGRYCGYTVAVKQIHEEIASPYRLKMFQREIDMVSKCRHPCLLQFIGATIDVGFPLLVTELMETSLRQLLSERSLSIREVSIISLDVARALNCLHKKRPRPTIHRDISSAIVLLWRKAERKTGIQEAQWRGKVSDYGIAKFMEQVTTQTPGCLAYSAPEVHTTTQTVKADVFSFGILLYQICTREYPEAGRRCEQVNKMSNRALQGLVRQCLQTNPDDRPDMTEIIGKLEQLLEVLRETCHTFKERNVSKALSFKSNGTNADNALESLRHLNKRPFTLKAVTFHLKFTQSKA